MTRSFHIRYRFTGFFQPVDNPGASAPYVINTVNSGRSVPLKFSLAGNQGLDILASGSPSSVVSSACTGGVVDEVEQTLTAAASGLAYDAVADQYVYTWKTEAAWTGQCRKLIVRLKEGSRYEALFRLKK